MVESGAHHSSGTHDVDVDPVEETVEVSQVRHVALNTYGVAAAARDRRIQLRLAPAGDDSCSPSAAYRCAVAKPMPLFPSVTSATPSTLPTPNATR
jgi:hypothetical protein